MHINDNISLNSPLNYNVSGITCTANRNTRFMFSNFFFRKSCRLLDNVGKYRRTRQATDGNIIGRMPNACWITKTQTHTEYVIRIAFSRQQWLRERASVLRYTYVFCLNLMFFSTVHHSIDLFHLPTLMHNSFIH